MKRNLLLVFLLSCSILLGVEGYQYLLGNDSTDINKDTNSQEPAVVTPIKPDPRPSAEFEVLPVLGESNKLTVEQKAAMAEWRQEVYDIAVKNEGLVFLNGPSAEKEVCLTFDDGPDDIITPQVLDILKKYNVKGNFFFKGNRIRKYPDVVMRTYREGNLVLSHAYSHQELNKMNAYEIDKEILATEKAFKEVLGVKPALIRPPFGSTNQDVINEISGNGSKMILWSIDTLDWSQREKQNIVKNVLDNVRAGDIILMHCDEDKQVTVEALPVVLEGLKSRGYTIVGLDDLLGVEAYKELTPID